MKPAERIKGVSEKVILILTDNEGLNLNEVKQLTEFTYIKRTKPCYIEGRPGFYEYWIVSTDELNSQIIFAMANGIMNLERGLREMFEDSEFGE